MGALVLLGKHLAHIMPTFDCDLDSVLGHTATPKGLFEILKELLACLVARCQEFLKRNENQNREK